MLRLSALYRFPVKSLGGESLQRAEVDALGLAGDRRWMVVDAASGRFLTQRQLGQMAQIAARWRDDETLELSVSGRVPLAVAVPPADEALRGVTVWGDSLQVPDAGEAAAQWLSAFLGRDCRLVHVPPSRARQVDTGYAQVGDQVGFADGFPLLLIGQGSLDDLSARVGRPLEMLRFRPNLVIEGADPYAEDGWGRLCIGAIEFERVKPCSRCAIPTLDPHSGERSNDGEPLKTLATYRRDADGVYFGQNLIQRGQGVLEVGMPVTLLD
ncbi:MAG: MOSC domain-containing protein [Pseudomonas sagittaria]|nr:MOSC domain-containing protein [Pseudomonas sagittaria]